MWFFGKSLKALVAKNKIRSTQSSRSSSGVWRAPGPAPSHSSTNWSTLLTLSLCRSSRGPLLSPNPLQKGHNLSIWLTAGSIWGRAHASSAPTPCSLWPPWFLIFYLHPTPGSDINSSIEQTCIKTRDMSQLEITTRGFFCVCVCCIIFFFYLGPDFYTVSFLFILDLLPLLII